MLKGNQTIQLPPVIFVLTWLLLRSDDVLMTIPFETLTFLDECDCSSRCDSWVKLPFEETVWRCDEELC
jgi:hypothetical protein